MRKYKVKALNGYIYVESYAGKDKAEWDRAKIYDENMGYIDYICLDGTTYKEYKDILDEIRNCKNIEDFIEYTTSETSYDYSESLQYLLESIFDDASDEEFEILENNLKTMTEKELLEEYCINKVGDYYFYVGQY